MLNKSSVKLAQSERAMRSLTQKQQEILDFILASLRDDGLVPTVREIAGAFGFSSTNAVVGHLDALAAKGYINRRPGSARNIEVAPDFLAPERGIPIIGTVAAGTPIDALENLEGYLDLDAVYTGGAYFALRVQGDSMLDAGIWPGDYAVVRQQPRVESGEIGVAIIDGAATVKRFRWLPGGGLELVPANENYSPFEVDADSDFRIAGKVVGLHRVIK